MCISEASLMSLLDPNSILQYAYLNPLTRPCVKTFTYADTLSAWKTFSFTCSLSVISQKTIYLLLPQGYLGSALIIICTSH